MRCRILLSESKLKVIDTITVNDNGIQSFIHITGGLNDSDYNLILNLSYKQQLLSQF